MNKYIAKKRVVTSYNALKDKTADGFWGLLGMLRLIHDENVRPNASYAISKKDLSKWLDQKFNLSEQVASYPDHLIYFRLSNVWEKYVLDSFLKREKLNLYDVISILYRNVALQENINSHELVKQFRTDFHLSIETLNYWFYIPIEEFQFDNSPTSNEEYKKEFGMGQEHITFTFTKKYSIKKKAGDLSGAPFLLTLYAARDSIGLMILSDYDLDQYYGNISTYRKPKSNHPTLQRIYFGCPGSGKSFRVNELIEDGGDGANVFRTTFHPESDYSTFVGCYKPTMKDDKICYEFVPQTFTDAYIYAYQHEDEPTYLILEEINRGNCAQIFGDLFQLLDRKEDGTSSYEIVPDKDLQQYLESRDIISDKLSLPANLHIIATMNTSDQSLFPMDSAFKRRWEWEYVPIELKDEHVPSTHYKIEIGEGQYRWVDFLEKVNRKIMEVTESEDKQMGNFFVKADQENDIISQRLFVNKVMSYLWFEVCKDNYNTQENLFRVKKGEDEDHEEFSFNELFSRASELLPQFMAFLEVEKWEKPEGEEEGEEEGTPLSELNIDNFVNFGTEENKLGTVKACAFGCFQTYLDLHPKATFNEIENVFGKFASFGWLKDEDSLKKVKEKNFYKTPLMIEGKGYYLNNSWSKINIKEFISVLQQSWTDLVFYIEDASGKKSKIVNEKVIAL